MHLGQVLAFVLKIGSIGVAASMGAYQIIQGELIPKEIFWPVFFSSFAVYLVAGRWLYVERELGLYWRDDDSLEAMADSVKNLADVLAALLPESNHENRQDGRLSALEYQLKDIVTRNKLCKATYDGRQGSCFNGPQGCPHTCDKAGGSQGAQGHQGVQAGIGYHGHQSCTQDPDEPCPQGKPGMSCPCCGYPNCGHEHKAGPRQSDEPKKQTRPVTKNEERGVFVSEHSSSAKVIERAPFNTITCARCRHAIGELGSNAVATTKKCPKCGQSFGYEFPFDETPKQQPDCVLIDVPVCRTCKMDWRSQDHKPTAKCVGKNDEWCVTCGLAWTSLDHFAVRNKKATEALVAAGVKIPDAESVDLGGEAMVCTGAATFTPPIDIFGPEATKREQALASEITAEHRPVRK